VLQLPRPRLRRHDFTIELKIEMTITRCTFLCRSVTRRLGISWDFKGKKYGSRLVYDAEFEAVPDAEEGKWLISEQFLSRLTVTAYRKDRFEPGKHYYFDISLAELLPLPLRLHHHEKRKKR
jgi:hypothetical protein